MNISATRGPFTFKSERSNDVKLSMPFETPMMQFCELILNLHLFFEADKMRNRGSFYVYLLVYDNGNDDDDDEGKDVDDDAVDDDDDGTDDDDSDDDNVDTCLVWEH